MKFLKSMKPLLDEGDLDEVFSYNNLVKFQILNENSLLELDAIFNKIQINSNFKYIFKDFTHTSRGGIKEFPKALQDLKFDVERLIGETMQEADFLITQHYKDEFFQEDPKNILVSNAILTLKPQYPTTIITEIADKDYYNYAYYYYKNEDINKNILFVPGLGWGYNRDKIIEIMEREAKEG